MAKRRRGYLIASTLGLLAGGAVVAGVGGCMVYEDRVVDNPGEHLGRDVIMSIIATESPVYYRDGVTPVGVFFQTEHRRFLPYEALPTAWVASILAVEDATFWHHNGVSGRGIARAMRDNLRAGRIVAGGSTLTQQTAKNLYYRADRSAGSKWRELLDALRLERMYRKDEILTFYANQFHVSGNGRGLAIAARYFFDVEPDALTLAESAFLAGLVKAPSRYDPFLGDAARRATAAAKGHDRTRWVLQRLLAVPADQLAAPDGRSPTVAETRAIQAEAKRLLDQGFELPFRRGSFRWSASAVVDEVARRLAEPPFPDLFAAAGIEDPATAGLTVITTLDPAVQREAEYALWHHLTEVGTWLDPVGADGVRRDPATVRWSPHVAPHAHEFRVGVVTANEADGLTVDLGGRACRVDRTALARLAAAERRGRSGDATAKAPTAAVDAWRNALPVGSGLWLSVREVLADGTAVCDLERTPVLQGAVVVAEQGRMRAMVGGNDNRDFNRATALRQFGSTWKPIVYHAALQLGWRPTDPLDNRRNVFPYSTTRYWPSPDHPPEPVVSLSQAGTSSENLASIWLLYHLMDRLDGEDVRVIAAALGLARREGEDDDAYARRIQEAGVLPTRSRLDEIFFLMARQEALADLGAHPEDALALASLLPGHGLDDERAAAADLGPEARATRERAIDDVDWLRWRARAAECAAQWDRLSAAVASGALPPPESVADLHLRLDDNGRHDAVCATTPPEGFGPPDASLLGDRPGLLGRLLGKTRDTLPDRGDVLVDERLHLSTLDALASAQNRRALGASLEDDLDLYAPDLLYWHPDFRVLLSLRYVAALARSYGVATPLQPVLSLPLGASEVTLEEMVAIYDGMSDGTAPIWSGRGPNGELPAPSTPLALIDEIRDANGVVLYKLAPHEVPVASGAVAEMTVDILRNVVQHGTGRRAAGAISLGSHPVPVAGKTGTTNDYRNAAFLGVIPRVEGEGWEAAGGFTVGVYVGYDDNRSLQNRSIRLQGANGALPVWIGVANGIARHGLLGPAPAGLMPPDLWTSAGLVRVDVDATGLPIAGDSEHRVLVRLGDTMADVDLRPIERPPRRWPTAAEAAGRPPARPIGFGSPDE